jgi:hypothetical protein
MVTSHFFVFRVLSLDMGQKIPHVSFVFSIWPLDGFGYGPKYHLNQTRVPGDIHFS